MDVLFTVGHSTRTMDEFVSLLAAAGIEAVVDVRRWPVSARHPHFSRDSLSQALQAAGLAYHHLGAALGGYRAGGYEAYMVSEEFGAGLRELEQLARLGQAAIL
ncbi:MAG: DUF488 family protein [Candidatus Methylomirabilia bacterium]